MKARRARCEVASPSSSTRSSFCLAVDHVRWKASRRCRVFAFFSPHSLLYFSLSSPPSTAQVLIKNVLFSGTGIGEAEWFPALCRVSGATLQQWAEETHCLTHSLKQLSHTHTHLQYIYTLTCKFVLCVRVGGSVSMSNISHSWKKIGPNVLHKLQDLCLWCPNVHASVSKTR